MMRPQRASMVPQAQAGECLAELPESGESTRVPQPLPWKAAQRGWETLVGAAVRVLAEKGGFCAGPQEAWGWASPGRPSAGEVRGRWRPHYRASVWKAMEAATRDGEGAAQ